MKQIRERWRELDRECFEIERRLGAVAEARQHPDIIDELRTYIITTK